MKKIRLILFMLAAPLLFGNFGMVEYAVLHPKTKTIQTDSLARKQKQVNLYAQESATTQVKSEEEKSTNSPWGAYLIMGMKAIGGFLLKILAHF
ncbi:hypothetical protein [Aquirufa sp. TARAVU-A1A]